MTKNATATNGSGWYTWLVEFGTEKSCRFSKAVRIHEMNTVHDAVRAAALLLVLENGAALEPTFRFCVTTDSGVCLRGNLADAVRENKV